MRLKVVPRLVIAFFTCLIVLGISVKIMKAAVCEPRTGGKCVGECCLTLMGGGCVAGPCDQILK